MTDQYQVFVLPADPDNTVSIRLLKRPGNRNVAHHAILGLTFGLPPT